MPSIRKRGDFQFEVRVRRKGMPVISKTFTNKRDAETWGRMTEAELDRGLYLPRRDAEKTTFAEVAARFEMEFAPFHYRGPAWRHKLSHLRAHLGMYALATISPQIVAKYRDRRLSMPDARYVKQAATAPRVSGATVKTELDLLSKVLDVASKEFGIALPNGNPVSSIRKPSGGVSRERRLVADEENRLMSACSQSGNPWLLPAVKLAVETAMRQGEIHSLLWSNIDFDRRIAYLRDPAKIKNEEPRAVPLSSAAIEVLQALPRHISGRVFSTDRMTLYKAFQRCCKTAGLDDFTFHDLRHEALSRLAERGDFTVLELAAVSGHKTLQMLKRYTHLQAESLARKLG